MEKITHQRLLTKVHYDPDTGVFSRLRARPCPAGVTPRPMGKTSTGRLQISVDGVRYEAGPLAWFYMTKSWPVGLVDHEDTDPFNNRWKNLRDTTPQINAWNKVRPAKPGKTTPLGVTATGSRFRAQLWVGGAAHYLGTHESAAAASAAYLAAKAIHHPGARA